MNFPTENKIITIAETGITITLTPHDYMLDKSVNGADVLILKKEAVDKIEIALDLEIVPYEKGNTSILPNCIVYKNSIMNSVVEHAIVKGKIKNREYVVEGIGEANSLTLTENFMGYIGTMARKRAISNAVISFFTKYLMICEPDNNILNEFKLYSNDEWQNKNNTPTQEPVKANVNPAEYVFNGGKYSGKTLAEVYQQDANYLAWVVEKKSTNNSYSEVVTNIKAFLETVKE